MSQIYFYFHLTFSPIYFLETIVQRDVMKHVHAVIKSTAVVSLVVLKVGGNIYVMKVMIIQVLLCLAYHSNIMSFA